MLSTGTGSACRKNSVKDSEGYISVPQLPAVLAPQDVGLPAYWRNRLGQLTEHLEGFSLNLLK